MMSHTFRKASTIVMTSLALLAATASGAFAAEALPTGGEPYAKVLFAAAAMMGAVFSIAVGAVGAALAIGSAAKSACEAVGRNPGVQGKIMMTMLVGMAMAESIAIYALVISLILLFANPYMKYFLF